MKAQKFLLSHVHWLNKVTLLLYPSFFRTLFNACTWELSIVEIKSVWFVLAPERIFNLPEKSDFVQINWHSCFRSSSSSYFVAVKHNEYDA
jgi:hypothetical protein